MIMTYLLRVIRVRRPQLLSLSLPGGTSLVTGQTNTGTILKMRRCYKL